MKKNTVQYMLLEAGKKLQFTDENDILYCVETVNDKVNEMQIEFSAWRNGQFADETFGSISAFEIYCQKEGIDINKFQQYDAENDKYF